MTELSPESNAPATKGLQHPMNAGMLAREVATVTPEATCNEVIKIFNAEPSLTSLVVVDGQKKVLGVLRSLDILRRGTEGYFQELLGRRSCTRLMDPNPLVFDAGTPLLEMSAVVAKLDDRHLLDGFCRFRSHATQIRSLCCPATCLSTNKLTCGCTGARASSWATSISTTSRALTMFMATTPEMG